MAKYRKKPVIIEATQWNKMGDHPSVDYKEGLGYGIHTLEGRMAVTPGDYIITGVHGEEYPCKPDIFDKTYEKVAISNCESKSIDLMCENCNCWKKTREICS